MKVKDEKMTEKKNRFDYLRAIAAALLLCALVFALYYIHSTTVSDIIAKLTEEDKYPNSIWFIEFLSSAIPIIAVIIVMNIMYSDKKSYVPIYTQIEKLAVTLFLTAFIFIALLSYDLYKSRGGDVVDPETEEVVKSLWNNTYMWFFAQVLPMMILIYYHVARIGAEKREVAEEERIAREKAEAELLEKAQSEDASCDAEEIK